MASLSRIKSTDSLAQWATKVNQIATSVETFIQTSGSFTSSDPQQTDLIVYNGTAWVNRALIGPITIDTTAGGATGVLKLKLEDTFISDRTELTSIDTSNDYLLVYDNSESSVSKIKKIKPSNITTVVNVGGANTQVQFNDGGSFSGATGFTYTKATNTLTHTGNFIVDTNVLYVDSANNRVGINKTNPVYPLDVVGNAFITGTLSVSGNISGTIATASQPSITSLGTLTSLVVSGLSSLSGGLQTTTITSTTGIAVTSGGLSVVGGILGTINTASQPNITGLGTVNSGAWAASIISGEFGGTGVNNAGKVITLAGSMTTSGPASSSLTLTLAGNTSLTLPLSGTLVNSAVTTLSSLTSIGTLTALNVGGTAYINGRLEQNVVDMASGNGINCSLGNYFIKTVNGNVTFTFDNIPSTRAFAFTLEITHTSGTITWPETVKWPLDIAPTLTSGKTHLFMFLTDDSGARWRGSALINYTN